MAVPPSVEKYKRTHISPSLSSSSSILPSLYLLCTLIRYSLVPVSTCIATHPSNQHLLPSLDASNRVYTTPIYPIHLDTPIASSISSTNMNAGVPSQQFAPPPYVDKTRWEKFVDVLRDLRLLVQPWWDRCSAIHKLLSYLAVIPIFTLFSLLIFTLCCSVATPLYSGIKYEMVSLGITIGDGVTYVGGSIGDGFGAVGNGLSTFGDVLAASLNYGKPDANSMNLAEYIGKQTDAIQTIDELESILWEGDSDMIATYIPHEA